MFVFQKHSKSNTLLLFSYLLLFFIGFCISPTLSAQIKLVNSPYSRVGLGTMHPTQFAIQRSMGGVSVPYNSAAAINYGNPASYSQLKLMTMEVGLQGNGSWLSTTTEQSMTGSGMINYLALAFPCAKWWGSSVGLLPYSSLQYDLYAQRYSTYTDTLLTDHRFIGRGTLYQVYWGNGFKIKNLSLGLNAAYVFGEQDRLSQSYFPTIIGAYGNQKTEALQVNGLLWNVGAQYDQKFKDKDFHLVLGATAELAQNLSATRDGKWERYIQSSGSAIDSIYQYEEVSGKVRLPLRWGIGAALKRDNHWQVATDYRRENWADYRIFDAPDSTLVNNNVIAIGVEYTPDYRAITKFWQSATYRGGFRYNTGRINISETGIKDWSVSLGLGMPLRKVNSRINIGFEMGQQGTTSNQLITETFFITTFGFTLNDRWFVKPKYD
ncbi:MAG: hypothetical protein JNM36_05660 [Chitinophagales bacterium]|nr:hypothetical protein [Chitinophagales bacterium]